MRNLLTAAWRRTRERIAPPRLEDGPEAHLTGSILRFTSPATDATATFHVPARITLAARVHVPRTRSLRHITRPAKPKLDHFDVTLCLHLPTGQDPADACRRLGALREAPHLAMEVWERVLQAPGLSLQDVPAWMYARLPCLDATWWGAKELQTYTGGTSFTFMQGRTTSDSDSTHYRLTLTDSAPA